MPYSRYTMFYQDYDWAVVDAGTDAFPDLNRKDGFEIQSFIHRIDKSRFASQAEKSILHKLERMIRESVPAHLKSQQKILEWLIDNYASVELT